MAPADIADALEVAQFHRGEDIGDFAAEHGDLVAQIEEGNGFEPNAVGQEIQPLGNFPQRPVAGHCRQFLKEIHVEPRVVLGVGQAHEQAIAAIEQRPHPREILGRSRHGIELADERGELHPQPVNRHQSFEIDIDDESADPVAAFE